MTLKRIFILESEGVPEEIKKNLKLWEKEGSLEFKSSISKTEYKRHIPEGYDLYLLHISNTEEDAIKELRERQPWSKILIRDHGRQQLSFSIESLIDGKYNTNHYDHYRNILRKINAKIHSFKEVVGEADEN